MVYDIDISRYITYRKKLIRLMYNKKKFNFILRNIHAYIFDSLLRMMEKNKSSSISYLQRNHLQKKNR